MVFGKGINDVPNSKGIKEYQVWHSMIRRCYSLNYQKTKPTYKGVKVCDDWLRFSAFLKDLKNMVGYDNLKNGWVLDKDILSSNDKVYSPTTCCLIPHEINGVFGNKKFLISDDLPTGVHYHKRNKKFIASCCFGNGFSEYLGSYDTAEEASGAYLKKKNERILYLAEKYKDEIDERVYLKLLNYLN